MDMGGEGEDSTVRFVTSKWDALISSETAWYLVARDGIVWIDILGQSHYSSHSMECC